MSIVSSRIMGLPQGSVTKTPYHTQDDLRIIGSILGEGDDFDNESLSVTFGGCVYTKPPIPEYKITKLEQAGFKSRNCGIQSFNT